MVVLVTSASVVEYVVWVEVELHATGLLASPWLPISVEVDAR